MISEGEGGSDSGQGGERSGNLGGAIFLITTSDAFSSEADLNEAIAVIKCALIFNLKILSASELVITCFDVGEHGRESIVIVGILLLESSFPGKLLVRETELLEIVSIELFITAKVHIASLLNSFQVLLGHVLHTLPVVQVNTGLGLRECSSFASNDPAIGHRPITESFMEGANADYAATLLTHIIL